MLTREEVYGIVRETAVNSISGFIRNRARRGNEANFQILDLIIPTERKIRSVVGGMETSLGTTLWEPLAKAIATGNGFEVIAENLQAPVNMPGILSNTVQNLIEGRNGRDALYTATFCHDRIKEVCQTFLRTPIHEFSPAVRGFGVDIWLRKDGVDYFFDTKTVQPNVGSYGRYFVQVLNWYAYFYSRFPSGTAVAKIVFPYNPYEPADFWQKTVGRGWPLEAGTEGWVQDDFWGFCSGLDNTYTIIYDAFKDIAESGELEQIIQEIFYGGN